MAFLDLDHKPDSSPEFLGFDEFRATQPVNHPDGVLL